MSEENATVDQQDVQNNKVMAVLAYFGILFLIPLLAAKESKFARFHANQGIILFIVEIVLSIIVNILFAISTTIGMIANLLYLVILVLAIIGIVNAATGKMKALPLIGNLFTIIK